MMIINIFVFIPLSFVKSRKLNLAFEILQYSIVMILIAGIYPIVNSIFFLFSWIKLVLSSLQCKVLHKLVFSLIIYPLLFPVLLLKDFGIFIASLICSQKNKKGDIKIKDTD